MYKSNVTKSFLPPKEEYFSLIESIWETNQLTNNGSLLKQFESMVKDYLGVGSFQFVTNGTLALQLAISGLKIDGGEIITTPFSYVATTSAILWQRCQPVFADIDPDSFCMDPEKIEPCITESTKAILPVHVFGNACKIERIEQIAAANGLKVIYDAAHAFGVNYNGKSIMSNGDVSVCSFHATKLFHTIEGGGIVCADNQVDEKIDLQKRFGHNADTHLDVGINAKANEFQAAMGICNLKYIEQNIGQRKQKWLLYDSLLPDIKKQSLVNGLEYNYAYFPVVFDNQDQLHVVTAALSELGIHPRRYFYPALNTLPYLSEKQGCPVAENIANRILCLPLWDSIDNQIIETTARIVLEKAIGRP
jgi:dTDP-4-amino-4,6-dideoxygalactose transaminase